MFQSAQLFTQRERLIFSFSQIRGFTERHFSTLIDTFGEVLVRRGGGRGWERGEKGNKLFDLKQEV